MPSSSSDSDLVTPVSSRRNFHFFALVSNGEEFDAVLLEVTYAMFDEPLLINDHSKCESAYTASKEFLAANKNVSRTIAINIWAYHELGDLEFDNLFRLSDRIKTTFDDLGAFIHTRGYRHSSTALSRANFNQFADKVLLIYVERLTEIISILIVVLILKYPVGLHGLPLNEKFGFNEPFGLLRDDQVELITPLITPDELEWLQKTSAMDTEVQGIIEWVQGMPDLTKEDLKQQWAEWKEKIPSLGKGLEQHERSYPTQ